MQSELPHRSQPRLRSILAWSAALISAALAPATLPTAAAQIDATINKSVWKMLYGVTDAQINDPAWLAADDDGDGLSNAAELAAGTNPFDRGSTHAVTAVALNADGTMAITFPTITGKFYVVQSSANLADANGWANLPAAFQLTGDGLPHTLNAPSSGGAQTFYRVNVQDIDTDGDGISDWAEKVTGFDPTTAHTHGATLDDHTALANDLATENIVTITATKAGATQPPDALTAATDPGTITVTRGGTLHFSTITVPLNWSGTALAGVDYAAMPSTVTFPPKVGSVTLTLVPLANAARRTGTTATVYALPGRGYSTGLANAATVAIAPAANAAGTGLTGFYYNHTQDKGTVTSAYNAAALFSVASLVVTRVDPAIDFVWTTVQPDPKLATSYYAVRWQGQVQPQYSETYYFDTKADDFVKLWVNGQLVIDGWSYQYADRVAAITLQAGALYDIQLDYAQVTVGAEAHLYWYSASQPKQVIPTNRLYPLAVTAAPPAITSAATTVGFVNQPFSFTVTASTSGGAPASFALGANSGPLPPGLSLNSASGVISGTPTTAGQYQVALTASNGSGTGAAALTFQILNPGSGVTRELWTTGVTGPLISDVPFDAAAPASTDTALITLEDNTAYPARTGERLRGYFTAPATDNYYFWLAANNAAELWISNDAEPVNKTRRAWVAAPGTGTQDWTNAAQTHERSPWLALTAGQRYYYEVLHNTGDTANAGNVAAGWLLDPTGAATTPAVNGATGVVPGFLLSRYDYPVSATTSGSLYLTNLSPQGASVSSAVGSADLRMNPSNTQAILHFNFSGLSSPRTAYHIHAAPDAVSAGPIVFDLDDVDKFHPELKTPDGGYIWNITASGALSAAQIVTAIQQGFAYFNVHTVNFPAGEIRGNLGLVQGSQNPPAPVADPGFTDDSGTDAGAARFLNQAAYGAAPADMLSVQNGGYSAWLDAQMSPNLPATHLYADVLAHPTNEVYFPYRSTVMQNSWWRVAVTAPDQLRQRVAFALSETLVVSAANATLTDHGEALSSYYDVLVDGAFGNCRDLLRAVTLHPTMGYYLNMQGNPKGNVATGLHPNENYGREIMQLFSIGLNRLWPDGTLVLDSQGGLVPTYDQTAITGMARVFTGWTWAQTVAGGAQPTNFYPPVDSVHPMTLVPSYHELGIKALLDHVVLPAATGYNFPLANTPGSAADPTTALCNAYSTANLDAAIDAIFNHPNIGPYLCRQLIQRLVTSNPTPGYLARVVGKFNDDGSAAHARGNLAAVVRAILLDGEARNPVAGLNTSGKQREPLLRIAAPARTFPYTAASGTYSQGGPVMNITLAAGSPPSRLAAYDSVALDFSANLTAAPPASPSLNPGSGAYTVLPSPAPTANSFSVLAAGGVSVGYKATAPTAVTPSTNLIVDNSGPAVTTTVVNGVTTNVYGKVYLQFLPPGGSLDGVYSVGDRSGGNLQVFTTTAPPTAAGSSVVVSQIGGTYILDNPAGATASRITFYTYGNHNLAAGDAFWLDLPTTLGLALKPAQYTVATVLDQFSFTVQNATLYPNPENSRSAMLYPLRTPPESRSGSVALAQSKFDMGGTNGSLTQTPLDAPTVFNFFYPDYKYPGALAAANVTTPEFQLTTDTNVITLTNTIDGTFLSSNNPNGLCSFNNGSILFDLSAYMAPPYSTADASIPALVTKLGDLLTGGQLTPATKTEIANYITGSTMVNGKAVANFPATNATNNRDRVRAIVQLILISPEYAVQR